MGGGGGKVGGPSSYNTLLSAPLAHLGYHYGPQREAVCSFSACYCHIYAVCFFLYSIGMLPISLHLMSSVGSAALRYFSRDTSHVSVRPIKTFLHDKLRRKFFPCTVERESVQFREEFGKL